MPTDWNGINGSTLYANGVAIGSLVTLDGDISSYESDKGQTTSYCPVSNQTFTLTMKQPNWFPEKLGKHRHFMIHSKSKRIRNKHTKIYDKKFTLEFTKFFGI